MGLPAVSIRALDSRVAIACSLGLLQRWASFSTVTERPDENQPELAWLAHLTAKLLRQLVGAVLG